MPGAHRQIETAQPRRPGPAGRPPFAAALRRAGTDVVGIQVPYGHPRSETTPTYAPPELATHFEALERLRRGEATNVPPPGRPDPAVALS